MAEYIVFKAFLFFLLEFAPVKYLHKVNIWITLMEFSDYTFVADKI